MKFFAHLKNLLRRMAEAVLSRLSISMGYRIERNIPLAMQRGAVSETAAYVKAKMANAATFKSAREVLIWSAKRCLDHEGIVLEFGVWQGNSLKIIAGIFDQTVYGFDSFQGLPEDWRSGLPAGTFALEKLPHISPNSELVVGWFSDTLDPFLTQHPDPIKFLHVDCDLYSSAHEVLEKCSPRLRPGSVIVFDEYFNYPNWQEGEFKAFQEVVAQRQIGYRYLAYNSVHEQVAVEITSTALR